MKTRQKLAEIFQVEFVELPPPPKKKTTTTTVNLFTKKSRTGKTQNLIAKLGDAPGFSRARKNACPWAG